ncbi:MAG TPA: pilus assembly protein PilZ [Thermotogales bacterium]|nr:pilus assembly protein PilZ [Thermotogales bacterium]
MVFFEKVKSKKVLKPGNPLTIETSDPEFEGTYKSSIHEYYPDRGVLKIGMPSMKGRLVPLPRGTIIAVKVMDGSSIYTFDSRVLDYGKDEENFNVTYITVPPELRRVQRRRYLRVPVVLNGYLKHTKDGEVTRFITKDISAGGALILLKKPLHVNEIVFVDLKITDGVELKEQPTRVVRDAGKNREGLYQYGVEFLDLDERMIKKILRFCFDIERKMKLQQLRGGR